MKLTYENECMTAFCFRNHPEKPSCLHPRESEGRIWPVHMPAKDIDNVFIYLLNNGTFSEVEKCSCAAK